MAVVAPAGVDVCVSDGCTPDCSAAAVFWLAVCWVLLAASAAAPGWLCAVSPPAAAGVPVVPDSDPAGGVVVGAGAGVVVAPGTRSPVAIFVKRMPVPAAAASSCTSRLGMSTVDGIALPRRTTWA